MVIRSWKEPFDKGRPSSRHTNSPGLPGGNFTLDLSLLGQSDGLPPAPTQVESSGLVGARENVKSEN